MSQPPAKSNRLHTAHFLLGFFAMPVCILLGGMEALFFRWHGSKAAACVGFFILFPLLGSIMTRQRVLTVGLLAGLLVSGMAYAGCSRAGRSVTNAPVVHSHR